MVFGTPTGFGNVSSQLKQFLDTLGGLWAQGLLVDKVYSGFTANATAHGGQESTLLAMYNTFYHFGGIVVAPGYTDPIKFVDGNPYGASHVNGQGAIPVDDTARAAAAYQGQASSHDRDRDRIRPRRLRRLVPPAGYVAPNVAARANRSPAA